MLDTELNQLVVCCVPSIRSCVAAVAVFRSTEPLRQSHAVLSGTRCVPPNNRRSASLIAYAVTPARAIEAATPTTSLGLLLLPFRRPH